MKPLMKITDEDTQLIHNIITERNLKEGAFRRFRTPILKYLKYHQTNHKNTTMTQLIKQAWQEQEQGTNPQKTKLYTYLTEFRTHLNQQVSPKTLHNYMITIKEVYRHNDIIIPQLKPFKIREPPQITYEDLPTKEDIRNACSISTIDMQSLILFQSSSGTSLHESLTINVGMFLKACDEYESYDPNINIKYQLNKLKQHNQIIPLLYLERIKTNKYYYTCCSPEATMSIIRYLLFRLDNTTEELTMDSKLFPYPKGTYTKRYFMLNERLGLGLVGKYSKFRSHALRKFHASNIGCSVETIDELQGRGKNTVHEAYIKDRPSKIKQEYMEHMHNILIFDDPTKDKKTSEAVLSQSEHKKEKNDEVKIDAGNDLVFQLIKTIGRLEQRIDELEKQMEDNKE